MPYMVYALITILRAWPWGAHITSECVPPTLLQTPELHRYARLNGRLMSNTARNTNHEQTSGSTTGRSTSKQKLKGATEVIHGIGENIRGRFMDTLDSSTKTGGGHPETHQGRREVEGGMAKLTGGPGVGGGAPRSETHPTHAASDAPHTQSNSASDRDGDHGRGQLAQEGNALGPTSAMTTGFGNGGPEAAAPYQQQYPAGGTGAPGGGVVREQGNDRDFGYAHAQRNEPPMVPGPQGSTPGPAPDRYSLGGQGPTQLP
ncbi:hypothetical protein OH76DRAFT_1438864 [Lentinus brumalis]|uniref:CsbD-like domain-containing protein n=1 Tax=Lentinus brumalis TaxID=2498619 RepID=A0A371DAC6_9APHY|nr:hypothetical protein OH76DRAFT_1438864 [Polyporus brumalis]